MSEPSNHDEAVAWRFALPAILWLVRIALGLLEFRDGVQILVVVVDAAVVGGHYWAAMPLVERFGSSYGRPYGPGAPLTSALTAIEALALVNLVRDCVRMFGS